MPSGPQALLPRQPVPALDVALTSGERYVLGDSPATPFDMLVFYRGLHCPVCIRYLTELERMAPQFKERGVRIVAISVDGPDRAREMAAKVGASGFDIAHGLDLETARAWGLYLSESRGKTSTGVEETAIFAEPGLFLVKPDRTLYYAAVQSMPFARPGFQDLLGAIDFAVSKDYPARGDYAGTA